MWRNTGKRVKFFIFDAYLVASFVLLLLFQSMITLYILIVTFVFFYYLDYKGYSLPNALRKIHFILSGKTKRAVHWYRRNNMNDS